MSFSHHKPTPATESWWATPEIQQGPRSRFFQEAEHQYQTRLMGTQSPGAAQTEGMMRVSRPKMVPNYDRAQFQEWL
jgi:hypothetical protein